MLFKQAKSLLVMTPMAFPLVLEALAIRPPPVKWRVGLKKAQTTVKVDCRYCRGIPSDRPPVRKEREREKGNKVFCCHCALPHPAGLLVLHCPLFFCFLYPPSSLHSPILTLAHSFDFPCPPQTRISPFLNQLTLSNVQATRIRTIPVDLASSL